MPAGLSRISYSTNSCVNKNPSPTSSLPFFMWLGYVFFVVYGSLVPLQYKALPMADAWAAFQNMPYLQLGVESRADWVANGVLYVPVGFLTAYLLMRSFPRVPGIFLLGLAAAFSGALALAVEFTQLYFPPRTVSQNDIIAECIGSLIGLFFSAMLSKWFEALLHSLVNNAGRLKLVALDGFVFAYLAFALFPFDFLLSWPEVSAKIDSGNWGWMIAGSSRGPILLGLQLAAEAGLTVPFGLLLARLTKGRTGYAQAVLIGLILGGLIEAVQFFMASGVSQGLSVLSRVLGVCGGLALSRHANHWTLDQLANFLRRYAAAFALPYLLALLEINGWFTVRWHGLAAAMAQLAEVNFMPFYYHYFTTEAIALFSLVTVSASYVPMGLMVWAFGRSPLAALAFASLSASLIESGKLFIRDAHPDPTNILLAGVASWLTVRLLRQLSLSQAGPVEPAGVAAVEQRAAVSANTPQLWLAISLAAAAVWTAFFPAFMPLVFIVLITCAVAVWHRPVLVFAIIPAALPIFDLAPWTGRFFIDEFDALILVGLAVAYARTPMSADIPRRHDPLFKIALVLVALSFAVSAARGLAPFQLPDANSFNNYFSSYNALRIFKGAAWAFLIYRLSNRFLAAGVDVRRPFSWGLVLGLGLTVAVIFWERIAFAGLWNFADDYRVTGPFSATHTGGAYADCFLAAALPFLIVLTFEKRHWLVRLAGMALILATTYSLMVTFSRGGYLSFAVSLLVVLAALIFNARRMVRHGLVLAGVAGAMLLVAVPIFKSEFAQSRFASAGADLGFRQAHWADALGIRDPGWATTLFGMGLGRFPETKYWRSTLHPKVGTYRLEHEKGNAFLRLDSGDSIGVDQFVGVKAGQQYLLKLDVRSSRPNARITIPICEKWLLTSANCVLPSVDLGKAFGAWRSIEVPFNTNDFPSRPWYGSRPVKLALTYAVPNSTIDIDNVRLEADSSTNLLRNGDFSQGLDHWYFATAGTLHAHWRVHSLYYGVLFDQGWFGMLALSTFIAIALGRAARKAWRGDVLSGASLAALSGFLAGGLFDTQIDTPRFLMLLLLLAWACVQPAVIDE